MNFHLADLFCGAGGTSAGAVEAIERLGHKAHLTAINHWPVAIATHTKNHPDARHLCTSIDDVNPRNLFNEGELDLLWASPECTHHSIARGGKPINDQSRATAWCVVRWAEALRPPVILIENVPEFLSWGPIGTNGRPLKSKRGEVFRAWKHALEALGYKVEHKLLCAADYGDPTTRTRLFVQAVRGRRKIVWPMPTHARRPDMLTPRAWRPARSIIDFSLPSKSIFARDKPLSPKTMKRIWAGLKKYGLKDFIVPQQSNPIPKTLDEPLGTIVAEGSGPKLVQPFILPQHGSNGPRSVDSPAPTVTTTSRGIALVEPFITSIDHGSNSAEAAAASIDDPLSTIVTKARHGVAEPYLIELRGTAEKQLDASASSIDDPCRTITAGGVHHGLVEPFLIKTANGESRAGEASRARSLDDPAPTICGMRGDLALIEPKLTRKAALKSEKWKTTCNCGHEFLGTLLDACPKCGGFGGHTHGNPVDIEPHLLPQQQGGALRPISEPVPTVATAGAIALVEPFLTSYYGTAGAQSLDDPLDTVTCKDRHALVLPVVEIEGNRYLLDIHFRMLQPDELAGAQGFPKGYKFTGNKSDAVKQIGNAVPCGLSRALVYAVLSQSSDVSALVEDKEEAA